MTQKTLDDLQPVLESRNFPEEPFTSVNKVKSRKLTALEVYERRKAAKELADADPLFDHSSLY